MYRDVNYKGRPQHVRDSVIIRLAWSFWRCLSEADIVAEAWPTDSSYNDDVDANFSQQNALYPTRYGSIYAVLITSFHGGATEVLMADKLWVTNFLQK